MMDAMDRDPVSIETFAAVIATSQIMIARPAARLPAGYGDADVLILNWIVAEAGGIGRYLVRM
jgi:hypothetical protein